MGSGRHHLGVYNDSNQSPLLPKALSIRVYLVWGLGATLRDLRKDVALENG
jgi:hypothetical protein